MGIKMNKVSDIVGKDELNAALTDDFTNYSEKQLFQIMIVLLDKVTSRLSNVEYELTCLKERM
jgi:hypothetical protein